MVRGVRTFPQFWKDYGSKISLVIILFLLSLVLVRYWLNSREVTQQAIAEQLTSARSVLEQYRQGNAGSSVLDDDAQTRQFLVMASRQLGDASIPIVFLGPEAETRIRGRVKEKVEAAVAETLKNSSDPARQAEATLLRADLNLHFGLLAFAESTAAPATQPTTKAFDKTPEQYFESAAKDYAELIAQAAKIPARTATAARFGMAAVHENRDERDKAKAIYDDIAKSGPDATVKKLAAARIDLLVRIPANPLLGPPSKPKPTTAPATTQATTGPAATAPAATQPTATPATKPSTQP
ncbi:tetratricopeptide repeat protein [Humisphaera borealis]|uniref:Uncharacterized protein n=1 Tax=Humisphaera borealis TaxID=2807512 RepID=A0A7M2X1J8_9BACT|nr:hypothetical protein [Humisphaera borealis]QOV91627.1 hypothetical protein IPV69_09795 [Humisphaera borealis]